MTNSLHSIELGASEFPPAPAWFGEILAECRATMKIYRPDTSRRQRKARSVPPDGLRTMAEAAAKLRCSIKTLKGHVASGALRYANIGHGKKRPTYRFTDADLDEFIANQTREDSSCPSSAIRARHIGGSTSNSKVIAFSGVPRPRPGAKPKK